MNSFQIILLAKYLKRNPDIEMCMMKLFIKHVKQMYLYIIGSDTECVNIALIFSLDIFIETMIKIGIIKGGIFN